MIRICILSRNHVKLKLNHEFKLKQASGPGVRSIGRIIQAVVSDLSSLQIILSQRNSHCKTQNNPPTDYNTSMGVVNSWSSQIISLLLRFLCKPSPDLTLHTLYVLHALRPLQHHFYAYTMILAVARKRLLRN